MIIIYSSTEKIGLNFGGEIALFFFYKWQEYINNQKNRDKKNMQL